MATKSANEDTLFSPGTFSPPASLSQSMWATTVGEFLRDSETIGLLSPTVLARYGKVGVGAPSFLGLNCSITIRSPHPIRIRPKTDAPGWVWGFFIYA